MNKVTLSLAAALLLTATTAGGTVTSPTVSGKRGSTGTSGVVW